MIEFVFFLGIELSGSSVESARIVFHLIDAAEGKLIFLVRNAGRKVCSSFFNIARHVGGRHWGKEWKAAVKADGRLDGDCS